MICYSYCDITIYNYLCISFVNYRLFVLNICFHFFFFFTLLKFGIFSWKLFLPSLYINNRVGKCRNKICG